MIEWKITYWANDSGNSPIEEWLNGLEHRQKQGMYGEIRHLALQGSRLRMPHSRPLGDGLFELRERSHGLRMYYGFQAGRIIIVLAAGDKDEQARDIATARRRWKESKQYKGKTI